MHSSVDGRMVASAYWLLYRSAVDISVHESFPVSAFSFSGCIPRCKISGSHGSSILKDPPCCFP